MAEKKKDLRKNTPEKGLKGTETERPTASAGTDGGGEGGTSGSWGGGATEGTAKKE